MLHEINRTKSIEEIILRHSSRGMDELKKYLPKDFCHTAAREILSWKRGNVILTTGFYVNGAAETDGPAGTVIMAKALQKLGFRPIIFSDKYTEGFFDSDELNCISIGITAMKFECEKILDRYNPVGLISIERCGKNQNRRYENMRGKNIGSNTAPCDKLFELAYGVYPTIGIGDGGNEIGMGNLAGVISRKLSLNPCNIRTDLLVIASVSNWGAYGVTAALEELCAMRLLEAPGFVRNYIEETVKLGSVDGVTGEKTVSVDGMDISVEEGIYSALFSLGEEFTADNKILQIM